MTWLSAIHDAVILSEAKNLGSALGAAPNRDKPEMFRFAQHDRPCMR